MDKNAIRDLKIKTGSVKRGCKDLEYSAKEIAKQLERIQQVKDDPEKDEHDDKKQLEVLAEMHAGVPTEVDLLDKYLGILRGVISDYASNADIKATNEYNDAVSVEKDATVVLAQHRNPY